MRFSIWGRAVAAILLMTAGCGQAGSSTYDRFANSSEVNALGNLYHLLPGTGGTPGLEVHAVRSSKQVIIHKIGIMPLIEEPDKIEGQLASGAAESVSAQLYARAAMVGGWTVVPQDDVAEVMQQLPPTTQANIDQNALTLGQKLSVDGVLYGSVHRYRERVGYDYAAQTPAAIAFTLHFVDEKSKQIVWTANYAREQKSLSENVLDLPNFIANAGRWVRANDLASQGCEASVDNLQSKLTIEPIVQGQY